MSPPDPIWLWLSPMKQCGTVVDSKVASSLGSSVPWVWGADPTPGNIMLSLISVRDTTGATPPRSTNDVGTKITGTDWTLIGYASQSWPTSPVDPIYAAHRTAEADDTIYQRWGLAGSARNRMVSVSMRGFDTPVEVARFSGSGGGGQGPENHSLTGMTVASTGLLFVCFNQSISGRILGHGLGQVTNPTGWTQLDMGEAFGNFDPFSWTGYKRVTAGTHSVDVSSYITVYDTFPGNLTNWAAYAIFVPDSADGGCG